MLIYIYIYLFLELVLNLYTTFDSLLDLRIPLNKINISL